MSDYEYKFKDFSITTKYLAKYLWNPFSKYIPARITPNSITLTGFSLSILSVFFVFLSLNGYRWCLIFAALCVFLYMACDNLDGIHARRTGQTSKLGEFLDHWFDTFNTTLLTLSILIVFKLQGLLLLITAASVFMEFIATSWDYYHNNVFYSEKFGATEVLVFIIISFISQFFLYDTKFLMYDPNHFSLVTLFSIITIITNIHITSKNIIRSYKFLYELILPATLVTIIIFYSIIKGISFFWAAGLILSINTLLSGGYFLSILIGKDFNKRYIGVIIFVIFGIIFLLFNMNKDFYTNFFIIFSTFMCLNIVWDFYLALRFLPGPNNKEIDKKTVSNGIY
jgi:phosphatidylglycerophosphate synthase